MSNTLDTKIIIIITGKYRDENKSSLKKRYTVKCKIKEIGNPSIPFIIIIK